MYGSSVSSLSSGSQTGRLAPEQRMRGPALGRGYGLPVSGYGDTRVRRTGDPETIQSDSSASMDPMSLDTGSSDFDYTRMSLDTPRGSQPAAGSAGHAGFSALDPMSEADRRRLEDERRAFNERQAAAHHQHKTDFFTWHKAADNPRPYRPASTPFPSDVTPQHAQYLLGKAHEDAATRVAGLPASKPKAHDHTIYGQHDRPFNTRGLAHLHKPSAAALTPQQKQDARAWDAHQTFMAKGQPLNQEQKKTCKKMLTLPQEFLKLALSANAALGLSGEKATTYRRRPTLKESYQRAVNIYRAYAEKYNAVADIWSNSGLGKEGCDVHVVCRSLLAWVDSVEVLPAGHTGPVTESIRRGFGEGGVVREAAEDLRAQEATADIHQLGILAETLMIAIHTFQRDTLGWLAGEATRLRRSLEMYRMKFKNYT